MLRGTFSCWAEPSHAGGDLPCSKSAGVSHEEIRWRRCNKNATHREIATSLRD